MYINDDDNDEQKIFMIYNIGSAPEAEPSVEAEARGANRRRVFKADKLAHWRICPERCPYFCTEVFPQQLVKMLLLTHSIW